MLKFKLLILVSLSQFLFIFHSFAQDELEYFEGQIIYDIEYTPTDDRFSAEDIAEWIGSKMILTFKDGNYKKEYFSPDGTKINERILVLKDNKSYSISNDSDTVLWVDITKHSTKTTFERLEDSTILNHPCTVIKAKATVNMSNEIYKVEALYFYAKDLPINPTWYIDFKEGNFYDIMKLGKGIAVLEVNKGLFWEQKLMMNSVFPRKVKKSELKLQLKKDTPLKEL